MLGCKSPPDFLSGVLIKGNDGRFFPADNTDDMVTIDQWVCCGTPFGNRELIIVFEVALPNDLPGLTIEAKEMPFGTKCIDPVTVYRGCYSGTDRIGGHRGVRTIPLMRPQDLSGFFLKAEKTFFAWYEFTNEVVVLGWVAVV